MRRRFHFLLAVFCVAGCAREHPSPPRSSVADSGDVRADRALDAGLPVPRMDSLAPPPLTHLAIAPPGDAGRVPPPDAAPAEPPAPAGVADRLATDDVLHPPILRPGEHAALGGHAHGWVELDVRVDEEGRVSDAHLAQGTGDPATARAAIRAAYSLRYYPARQSGRAVAVWCRQRFEAGR